MMNSLAGDAVTTPTKKSTSTSTLELQRSLLRAESNPMARKRRIEYKNCDFKTFKTPRRNEINENNNTDDVLESNNSLTNDDNKFMKCNDEDDVDVDEIIKLKNEDVDWDEKTFNDNKTTTLNEMRKVFKKPPIHPDLPKKSIKRVNKKDDSARLRKTIQWLEEGARKLREDLANVRSELYEERKAFRLAKRDIECIVKDIKNQEAAKYHKTIAELKARLSQFSMENLKEEHTYQKPGKKRLIVELSSETNDTIRKIKPSDSGGNSKKRKLLIDDSQLRKMEYEIRNLRDNNVKLEDKLHILGEELKIQHEKYEGEMSAVKKALTIKMMKEIRSRERDIEKLEKLIRKKQEDELMRKLRESERGHQIRLDPNNKQIENHVMSICKGDCESVGEVERLRELAVEQQEIIEYLRQALKEKERKLDQLSNKKRKEEFYKQWLELEPVAEVDDEEEHEEGDSALSSAPSSLSPQPGGWQTNGGVTRETYETLLLEVDELQTKYFEEHEELIHAKSQVRDLEKALLQETRGSQTSRRALSDKLKEAEERESSLVAQMSELREQNELLEFRVLELEEGEPRKSPDTADSGIVSPEPPTPTLFKDKQRDRAVATVIPYNSYSNQTLSPIPVQKSLLSLQESGIFEEDDDHDVELANCATQTDSPAGELLQEVQRLQELRERFQERAVKVPSLESFDNDDNRLIGFKDKIRQLEEQINKYEESEMKKNKDQLIAKQREEDLLDENYRLTERLYYLENEIQNLKCKVNMIDVGTMTKRPQFRNASTITEMNENKSIKNHSPLLRSQKMFYDNLGNLQGTNINSKNDDDDNQNKNECCNCQILKKDYEEKIQNLIKAENSLRKQMIDLEKKENSLAKTLQQIDTTWSLLETDQAAKLLKIKQELTEKILLNKNMIKRISELEDCIRNHSCKLSNQDEVDGKIEDAFETSKNTLKKINQNEEPMDIDRWKMTGKTGIIKTEELIEEKGSKKGVSRVHLQFEEYPENDVDDDNAICKSEADDEKVSKRESRHSEYDGWAMRTWNASRNNCIKKSNFIDVHRLVLYPEICV